MAITKIQVLNRENTDIFTKSLKNCSKIWIIYRKFSE